MRFFRAVFALPVLAATLQAVHAGEHQAYVSGMIGINMPDDENFLGANAAGQGRDIQAQLDDGTQFGLSLGLMTKDYDWGRVRGEVEVAYRESDLEGLVLNAVSRTIIEGSGVDVTTAMVNLSYDTPKVLGSLRFSLGAGYGLASVTHDIRYLVANAAAIGSIPGQLQIAIPNSETTDAYQLIGGAEVELTPGISLIADVRYLEVGDTKGERYILNSIINGVATTNGTLDSILDADYSTVSLNAGLRIKL